MKDKTTMQLGMIGLGRMGANMVRRLICGGHQCVVYDRAPQTVIGSRRCQSVRATVPAPARTPTGVHASGSRSWALASRIVGLPLRPTRICDWVGDEVICVRA